MSGVNEMSSYMKAQVEKAIAAAKEAAGVAHKEAVQEYIPLIEEEYEGLYKQSTAKWYSAYTPRKYHRHYSIYNLFTVDADPNAMKLAYEMSEENMTKGWSKKYNRSFSLWNMVFIKGYHGGPRPGFSVRSEPVPDMFGAGKEEIDQRYRDLIKKRTIERYYQITQQT